MAGGFSSAFSTAFGVNTSNEPNAEATPSPTAPLETEFYMLTVAEISEITDLTNIFIWEEDAYNFGKVWG